MLLFGLMQFLSLFLIFALSFTFLSKIWQKLLLSTCFGFLLCVESVAFYAGESFINEMSFLHFNDRDLPFLSKLLSSAQFIVATSTFFIITGILSYLIFALTKKYVLPKKAIYPKLAVIIICISALYLEGGMYRNLYWLYATQNIEQDSFDNALESLGISPASYIKPTQIKATAGKNIVVIALESFDRSFFKYFKDQTPHLNMMKDQYTYYEMSQSDGGAITVAATYSYMTGLPMFFCLDSLHRLSDKIDDKTRGASPEPELTAMSSVLEQAGYEQLYISGAIGSFGATKSFLNFYGVNFLQTDVKEDHSGWLVDRVLFSRAKQQIKQFNNDKPFAVYIATLSTHGPSGLHDKAMEDIIEPQPTELAFNIASTDYLLNDFIEFLKKENMLDNTVFYIFPDHKFMFGAAALGMSDDNRGLYMISNAENSGREADFTDLTQIDIPNFILNGAQVKHNATFLSDYIDTDKLQFINDNKANIIRLNEASLR